MTVVADALSVELPVSEFLFPVELLLLEISSPELLDFTCFVAVRT